MGEGDNGSGHPKFFFFKLPHGAKPLEARGEAASYIYNNKNTFGSWKENEVAGFIIFSQ